MKFIPLEKKQYQINKDRYCIYNGIKIYDNTKIPVENGYVFPIFKENLGSVLDIFSSIGSGIADVGTFIGTNVYEGLKWTGTSLYNAGTFSYDILKDTSSFLKESNLISNISELAKSGVSVYSAYQTLTGQTPSTAQSQALQTIQAGLQSGKYVTSIPQGQESSYNQIDLGDLGTIYEKKDYTTYYIIGGASILILIAIIFLKRK